MVCLGNICRSPLAEGILKSKVNSQEVFVDSAGTGDYHVGHGPDPRSVSVASQNQMDITSQRGRQFSVQDFDEFDKIYVMDMSNYHNVLSLARNESDRKKVDLILNEVFPGENVEVPDPHQGDDNGFTRVHKMLDEACEIIAEKYKG